MINLKTFHLITIALMTNLTTGLTAPYGAAEDKPKKLVVNAPAPSFTGKDVNGKTLKLEDFKGKKILLSFHRNVGCPICNLRFHELEKEAAYFKTKGLILIGVYESTADNMKLYLEGINPYSIMVPDPTERLYDIFGVEQSTGKVLKGIFNGAMKKAKQGKALQNRSIKQDGNLNRIGADFLIDENGIIKEAHYGRYLGDHLELAKIKKFLE